MSARDRLQSLLDRIVTLSSRGEIEWARSEIAPRSFEYVSATGAKVVIDSRDDDGHRPFDLIVYSPDGEVVGTISWSEAGGAAATARNRKLRQVYESARDTVSGAADIIQGVLDELPPAEDDIPF